MKLLALMAIAMCAFGADVSGKWTATVPGQDGEMKVVYNLKVDAGKVSGSVDTQMGEMKINSGKFEDGNISFTVETEQFKVVHTGTINGSEMKLKVDFGERVMEVTARKTE